MQLKNIAEIQSGHLSRRKIEPREKGTHFLLQARDVDGHRLAYRTDAMLRFSPDTSHRDWVLKTDDILFMARGARNFSILLEKIPEPALAAACFFIVRVTKNEVLPGYLCWHLNQAPVKYYLARHSGRGVHMPVVKRSVLEKIDVPIPPLEIQKRIEELTRLMGQEQALLFRLAEKKRALITAASLRAVKESSDTRLRK